MGMLKLGKATEFILNQDTILGHEQSLEIKSELLQHVRLGNLSKLPKKIGLYCPRLVTFDPLIWQLPGLEILTIKSQSNVAEDFFGTQIPKIATSPLRILRLSGLGLKTLPAWIGQFSTLEEIDLNHNELSELPLELAQLKKCNRLNLEANQFKKIPVCLTRMDWINHLALDDNPLLEEERQLAFDLWGIWF